MTALRVSPWLPAAALALALLLPAGASAQSPRFGLPVDCPMGTVCTIQNYYDMEPGDAAKDQTCGPLTYNGSHGVDFRVPTYVEMREGVAVVAAAPGVVRGLRDGMDDVNLREIGREAIRNREAGNGVVLDHGNGWESQYSHMRKDSIVVKKGQQVAAGDKLGLIGLSGMTEFPHLDFSLRHDGQTIDPYTGLPPESGCGQVKESLWRDDVVDQVAYQSGGLLAAGFADAAPEMEDVLQGKYRAVRLPADTPALVFWAAAWGLRGGDRESIRVLDPNGAVFAEAEGALPRDKADWFRFAGKKLKAAAWPAGVYKGRYKVERGTGADAEVVIDVTREIEVR